MKTQSHLLTSLLLLGALSAAGCGPANAAGDTETSAQAATVADDGVHPVAATPGDGQRDGHHRGRHHGWFRKFDSDRDGKIALADLPEHKREHVAAADTNHDGFVTQEEMHTMKQAKFAQMKAEADSNHDGTVSDEERKAAHAKFAEKRFLKHDTNGDQALTSDEVSPKKWERVKKADANGDGKVTSQEFTTAVANGTLGKSHGHKHHRDGAATGAKPTVL